MEKKDLIDRLQREWNRERPDLNSNGMGVVGRIILLGEELKKSAAEALAPFNIGYTDLDVLATLRRSGEPYTLRPATLLKTVLIQSGSLTACLDRLEKRGFVDRVLTPGDRRGRSVQLSPKGRELVDRAIEARFAEALSSVNALDDPDRQSLERLLRQLLLSER